VKVTVQLFAEFRRATGAGRFELELPGPATVGSVIEAAHARYPVLRQYARSTLVAKGLEFAQPDDAVREGDEISLMPPVMGG
jgi:molybdopterin converting factor small subunit